MLPFLLRRLSNALVVAVVAASLGFIVLHIIPGDPFGMVLEQAGRNATALTALRSQFGLDQPLLTQYAHFMSRALSGDFGTSLVDGQPVLVTLQAALSNSLLLGTAGLLLAVLLGSAIGSLQGWRPRARTGKVLGTLFNVWYAAPEFIIAIALITLLAYRHALFPVGGIADPVVGVVGTRTEQAIDALWHLALPALTLAIGWGAAVARQQRSALLEICGTDHVRGARAKGVNEHIVFRHHAFRLSFPSVIVVVGLMLPELIGGAVVIETLFAWPGLGSLLLRSVTARDYPVVSACIVVVGIVVSCGTFMTDVLIAALNPRMRTQAG